MADKLTHLDKDGHVFMVDIGHKETTQRSARAMAHIHMKAETLALISNKEIIKGDVFATARVAGIMAAKKTSDFIPLCHPLALSKIAIDIHLKPELPGLEICSYVALAGKTGVEMEALTAVSVCCLTIYDMVKSVDKYMIISNIHLLEKTGGKSGSWVR